MGLGVLTRHGIKDRKLQICFPAPTPVLSLSSVAITQVSCGAMHTAVISSTGQLFTFGCGNGGRLGLGNHADISHPELVSSLENERVVRVTCSTWHTLCIVAPRLKFYSSEGNEGWVSNFLIGIGA